MNNAAGFEQSIKGLEEIVTKLESGKLSLEESIALYNKGKALSEGCRKILEDAKLTVETANTEN